MCLFRIFKMWNKLRASETVVICGGLEMIGFRFLPHWRCSGSDPWESCSRPGFCCFVSPWFWPWFLTTAIWPKLPLLWFGANICKHGNYGWNMNKYDWNMLWVWFKLEYRAVSSGQLLSWSMLIHAAVAATCYDMLRHLSGPAMCVACVFGVLAIYSFGQQLRRRGYAWSSIILMNGWWFWWFQL